MKAPLLLLLLTLGCGLPLRAGFDIISVNPAPNAETCKGEVLVDISGQAGPFTVTVVETGAVFHNVDGLLTIPDLCAGTFTLQISPTRFPACATDLSVEVPLLPTLATGEGQEAPPIAGKADFGASPGLPDDRPSIMAFPNPAEGKTTVSFAGFGEGLIQLDIFDARGSLLMHQDVPAGSIQAELDLAFLPRGAYFAIATRTDGHTAKLLLTLR